MGLNLEFFIWKDGRQQGPFSSVSIDKAIRMGRIPSGTPVWTNQDPTWRSAAELLKTLSLTEQISVPAIQHSSIITVSPLHHKPKSQSKKRSSLAPQQLKIGLAAVAAFGLILILLISRLSLNSATRSNEPEWIEDSTTDRDDKIDSQERPTSQRGSEVRIAVTVEEAEKCVLMARSDEGSGTAFIAVDKGKYYVYTNVHVASSRSLEFSDFRGRSISISPSGEVVGLRANSNLELGIDIVRFPLISSTEYALRFASRTTIENRPHVWALGDSGGESILKTLPGNIKGVGPSKIEVDCEFIPGNSGGPIVNSNAEVVGIASYLTRDQTIWAKGTEQEIRRMAWIPGIDHFWMDTTLRQLEDERLLVDNCLDTSGILWVLLRLRTADTGFIIPDDFPDGVEEAREFLASVSPHPLTDFDRISASLKKLKISGKSTQEMQQLEYDRFFEECASYQDSQLDQIESKVGSSFWKKELYSTLKKQRELMDLFKTQSDKFSRNGQVGNILGEL